MKCNRRNRCNKYFLILSLMQECIVYVKYRKKAVTAVTFS